MDPEPIPLQPESVITQSAPPARKFNPILILTILVLLIAVGAGGIFLGKFLNNSPKSAPPTIAPLPTQIPSLTPTPDEMVNWKTYQNPSLGFELKYPLLVRVDKELNDQYNRVTIFKGGDLHFEVMLRKNPGNITLDNYYFMDSPIKKKTALAGISANVYEMPNGYCDGPSCSEPYITIVTEKGLDFYHISFFGDIQLSEVENQILSTFKFLQ